MGVKNGGSMWVVRMVAQCGCLYVVPVILHGLSWCKISVNKLALTEYFTK